MQKEKKPIIAFSAHALASGYTAPTQEKVEPLGKLTERRTFHIGVADLDVFVGYLPEVFAAINEAQETFRFQKVLIPIRSGISMSGDRTNEIVKSLGQRISKRDLASNVYAPDLYAAVHPVLKRLSFDVLGLLVSRMIMDKEGPGKLLWNLFWTGEARIFAVSAYDVQRYSIEANRPIEACVASMAIAAAFSTLFPQIPCHPETRGCIYDYCEDRDDAVEGFKKMTICEESLAFFPEWLRTDAKKVVRAIADYRRVVSKPTKKATSKRLARRKPKPKAKS